MVDFMDIFCFGEGYCYFYFFFDEVQQICYVLFIVGCQGVQVSVVQQYVVGVQGDYLYYVEFVVDVVVCENSDVVFYCVGNCWQGVG